MGQKKHLAHLYTFAAACTLAVLSACSASNCPLESNVTCNYGFYDSQGSPVAYNDTITVSTLLAGSKTQYVYRKLGAATITNEKVDSSLIRDGYTMIQREVRRDTILANKLTGAKEMKLPMAYFSSYDTLVVNYASLSNNDTIEVGHYGYSNVELPECGTHRFHQLRSIRTTTYGIDHIEIVNPQVNYEGKENIKIYFNGTAGE